MRELPKTHELAKWATWRALNDFDYFCFWLTTRNEATKEIERWPNFPYLSVIGNQYQQSKILWVPKSRRTMLTWITCAFMLWEAMRYSAYLGIIQSQTEKHSVDHMRNKVKFLWDHMPYWLKYFAFGGNMSASFTQLDATFPNGNRIMGVPQGAHQFRQYTPSTVFVDEASHQEQFEDTMTALIPFLEKDTKLLLVSSVAPGYFWSSVTSQVYGEKKQMFPANPELPEERQKGVQYWRLKHGGEVLQVHYSADPSKGMEWLMQMDKDIIGGINGPQWEQEMEISGDAFSGQRVYPHYVDRSPTVVSPHLVPPDSRKWLVGDYGYRNPTCFLWIYEGEWDVIHPYSGDRVREKQHYFIYDEFYESGWSIEDLKSELARRCGYDTYEMELLDPSTDWVREADTQTHFWLFNNGANARNFQKANNSPEGKILIGEWLQQGRLHVFNNCVNTRKEFLHYRHEEWSTAGKEKHNPKEKVIKKMDHAMDALRYFANHVRYEQLPRETLLIPEHPTDMVWRMMEEEQEKGTMTLKQIRMLR